jgi:hypothetical protein
MGSLQDIVVKLKSWLGQAPPAGASVKADTASPAEQETPTNAQPEGASDEPWSGT